MSTYVPKNCGLATFTNALVQQLRISPGLPKVTPSPWTSFQCPLISSCTPSASPAFSKAVSQPNQCMCDSFLARVAQRPSNAAPA